jgi:hypothetical protein
MAFLSRPLFLKGAGHFLGIPDHTKKKIVIENETSVAGLASRMKILLKKKD